MGGVLLSSTHVVRQLLKKRLRLWLREGTHRVKNMWRASAENLSVSDLVGGFATMGVQIARGTKKSWAPALQPRISIRR